MLWPGIKKLGKELNLKRSDFEAAGILKNCFVKMYDGRNMKVLELYTPQMDGDDKNDVIKMLENRRIKKYEWLPNGVKITFVEILKPYSMKKIKEILEEIVKYFSGKYPDQKTLCQHCGEEGEAQIYGINNVSLLICDNCYRQYARDIEKENTEQINAPNNYLLGFIGAIIFSIPGIIVTTLFLIYLERLAGITALIYVFLGILGYKKFKGKLSPVGAGLIILAGVLMVGIGVLAAYCVLIFKELEQIDFDLLLYVLREPEVQKEIVLNIGLSYLISAVYFFLQFRQLFREWKNIKSIHKLKDI
ncbi:MAG: hypothetical protein FWB77_02470 [Treponema sp.]|nr:hypothetical protein [Treponema sp.]